LAEVFDNDVPELAYEVRLSAQDGDGLIRIERTGTGEHVRHDVDPQTDWLKRFDVGLLSGLPIDWLL
jgi:hypothetical protein